MRDVLGASLPARWSSTQRAKNTAIYWTLRALVATIRFIPFPIGRTIALALGLVAWAVDWPDRRRAAANLAHAMPELSPGARRALVRRMFLHLAESAIEAIHVERFVTGPHAIDLGEANRQVLATARACGKGVVAVGGHIGNWELVGQIIARAGFPVTSIAKPLYDPRLTRWVNAQRTAFGARILWRGDSGLPKEMLRVFKNNGVLGMLIDQDTRVQGAFVPFFGRPAHTPTAAASLTLRTGAALVIGWGYRRHGTHEIHFEPFPFTPSGDHDADVVRLTTALNARLEEAIRAEPSQWVWLHNRWKKQPPGVDNPAKPVNTQSVDGPLNEDEPPV